MNAKEKAEELVNKHRMILIHSDTDLGEEIQCSLIAKQCALIAVDEILSLAVDWCEPHEIHSGTQIYWQEVEQEIEKL
jgi:hypothetical protein